MNAVDGCVVLSEAVLRELRALGINKPVRQVPHGVYTHFGEAIPPLEARRQLNLPQTGPLLLFFGFVRAYKGLRVLLESLPSVLRSLPSLHLVVAGEFYEDIRTYQDMLLRLDIQQHVHLHAHYIPSDNVAAYFSAADVVVQPYNAAAQSGVAHIAFQYDKPLIVADVGGLAETVPHEEAGLVVPPHDPAALAEAIVRFFREDMAPVLQEGARRQKKHHGWDPICEAVESFL